MVWFCVDCNFFTNQQKDRYLIKAWNETISNNDLVIILGDFFYKCAKIDFNEAKQLLSQLTGKKHINDYLSERYSFSKQELVEIGFDFVGQNGCFWNKDNRIVAAIEKNDINKIKQYNLKNKDKYYYVAAAKSLTKQHKPFENDMLSLSIEDWGNYPLAYNDIPNLLDNMIEFEKLEV